jgi:DNA-binding IclR family transcriptional regulator
VAGKDATVVASEPEAAPSYRAPAVTRAMAVIELLVDSPEPQKLSTIARELEMPKSSCFTILSTLEAAGYVRQGEDNDAWALTLRLYYLGMKTAQAADIVPVAQPLLERLRDETGLTSNLALLDARSISYAIKVDAPSFVRFETTPGRRASLHLTAVARAVLAHLPTEVRNGMLRGYRFEGGTSHAFRSRREFDAELERVRKRGFAVEDQEEMLGVRCLAAPLMATDERCIGAVGVVGLAAEVSDPDAIATEVIATARRLSDELYAAQAS